MANTLIVLPHIYPYSKGESFVENEREAWQLFDKIIICPLYVLKGQVIRNDYKANRNEYVINPRQIELGIISKICALFGPISPKDVLKEIWILIKSNRLRFKNIKKLFFITLNVNNVYRDVIKNIEREKLIDNKDTVIVYSYWFYESALVGVGLKKRYQVRRFISRAHGNDLYEEARGGGYIPYRHLLLESCNNVYPISNNGRDYLLEKYGERYYDKIIVRRLGTVKLHSVKGTINLLDDKLIIVSCSGLIPLKRINRIIEMLKQYDGICQWYHFGDGELMEQLQTDASDLPQNIHACFMGYVSNDEVQKFYSEHYIDVFINVSESEGVPVSIMEAQSYGIPVIATDVGGTNELVHSGKNGILLCKDFSTKDLLDAIETVKKNSDAFRKNAIDTWKTLSDAKHNYNDMFAYEISQIEGNNTHE